MFLKKNGQRRYKYLILARDKSYVVKLSTLVLHSKLKDRFTELVQQCVIKRMANVDTNTLF